MFARDLHVTLATVSILAIVAVAAEGGVRALRGTPPSRWSSRAGSALAILLGMTIAGGLALLLGGHRPRELLHVVYAILALGAVPVADMVATRRPVRTMALSRLGGALVGLAVVVRLVATG